MFLRRSIICFLTDFLFISPPLTHPQRMPSSPPLNAHAFSHLDSIFLLLLHWICFYSFRLSSKVDTCLKLFPRITIIISFCVSKHLIHTSIATHIFYTIAYLWKSVAKYYSSSDSQDLNQCLAPTRITLYACWVSRLTSDSELIQAWIPKNNI